MTLYKPHRKGLRAPGSALICLGILFLMVSCERGDLQQSAKTNQSKSITVIESEGHFNGILETSDNRLLLFEFYADWCTPCEALEPILEELAQKHKEDLSIYKIDYDYNQKLSNLFKVPGLPYVAFVKDKVIVHSMLGLHPKGSYIKAIEKFIKE